MNFSGCSKRVQSHIARPHSALSKRVLDMAIEWLVAQEFKQLRNPVMTLKFRSKTCNLVALVVFGFYWCLSHE